VEVSDVGTGNTTNINFVSQLHPHAAAFEEKEFLLYTKIFVK
jgi:hypothetical protein